MRNRVTHLSPQPLHVSRLLDLHQELMNESLKNILGGLGGPQWVSLCGSQGLRLQHTDPTVARVKFVEQPQDPHYSHVQGR